MVYLRREEEKSKAKARVMVAITRESIGAERDKSGQPSRASEDRPRSPFERPGGRPLLPLWVNKNRKPGTSVGDRKCFYCGEVGRLKRTCNKLSFDEAIAREQEALEKLLRSDD